MGDLTHDRSAMAFHTRGKLLKPRDNTVITCIELPKNRRAIQRDIRRATDNRQPDATLRLFFMVKAIAIPRVSVFLIRRRMGG